jgi:hypothetical protein
MSAPNTPVAHFFWEGILTNFQLLSFKSAHDAGFKVIVWSLTPHKNLPEYVEGRDSIEYFDPKVLNRITQYYSSETAEKITHSNIALYSDFFRAAVLAKLGGWWFDADVVVLRPAQDYVDLAATRTVVVGHEQSAWISFGIGVLHFVNKNLAVDYFNTMRTKLENVSGDLPWAFFGPKFATHYLIGKGVINDALPENAFYPIPFADAPKMYQRAKKRECNRMVEGAYAIHWWNSAWHSKEYGNTPPVGSFFEELFTKHGFNS